MKEEFSTILHNSIWLLGNGQTINFWNHAWCGPPLAYVFHIPMDFRQFLTSTVSDYILDNLWNIPFQLIHMFPNLYQMVKEVVIPLQDKPNQL